MGRDSGRSRYSADSTIMRFPPVHVSQSAAREYHRRADQLVTDAARAFEAFQVHDGQERRWAEVRARNGVRVLRDRFAHDRDHTRVVCTGFMHGQVRAIINALCSRTTEEYRTVQSLLSGRFSGGIVLDEIESESSCLFAGIKWRAVRGPMVAAHRDMCMFEKLGVRERDEEDKPELGYLVFESIDIPECPPLGRKYVRMNLSVCFLVEQIQPNVVELFMTGQFGWRALPVLSRVAYPVVAYFILRFTRWRRVSRAKRFSFLHSQKRPTKETHHIQWKIRMHKRPICGVCGERIALFHTVRSCAGCDTPNVCRKCRSDEFMFALDTVHDRVEKATFCTACRLLVDDDSAWVSTQPSEWRGDSLWTGDDVDRGMSISDQSALNVFSLRMNPDLSRYLTTTGHDDLSPVSSTMSARSSWSSNELALSHSEHLEHDVHEVVMPSRMVASMPSLDNRRRSAMYPYRCASLAESRAKCANIESAALYDRWLAQLIVAARRVECTEQVVRAIERQRKTT